MNAAEILARLRGLPVLVAGDLHLDRWSKYDPFLDESSGSLPIVATESAPGGCGCSAAVLAALGAQVTLLGLVGEDGAGFDLRAALARAALSPEHLIAAPTPTAATTRLINARTEVEDAPRLQVIPFPAPPRIQIAFLDRLQALAEGAGAVLFAVHRAVTVGGVLDERVQAVLPRLAAPLVWLETPQALQAFRGPGQPPLRVEPDGQGLLRLLDGETSHELPEDLPVHPLDIHGGRETFSAAMAAALAAGANAPEAARFALRAAAVCMMKPGAACASPAEILGTETEFSA